MELDVPDISCGHCAGAVTKALKAQDPAAHVEVDIAGKRVKVETSASREDVEACLAEAGYPVRR